MNFGHLQFLGERSIITFQPCLSPSITRFEMVLPGTTQFLHKISPIEIAECVLIQGGKDFSAQAYPASWPGAKVFATPFFGTLWMTWMCYLLIWWEHGSLSVDRIFLWIFSKWSFCVVDILWRTKLQRIWLHPHIIPEIFSSSDVQSRGYLRSDVQFSVLVYKAYSKHPQRLQEAYS